MIKQVYRFISVLIISNLLFIPTALSQTQADAGATPHKSFIQRLFGHKKHDKQKPDSIPYGIKYGVYFPSDGYNTYPPVQPDKK